MRTLYKAELITEKANETPAQLKKRFFNGNFKNMETITPETETDYYITIGDFSLTEIGKHSKKAFVLFNENEYYIINNLFLVHHSKGDREYYI